MSDEENTEVTATWVGGSTVVHNYRFFYYLANEQAYNALEETYQANSFRYSMGTVIFSYTTIEIFINHILLADSISRGDVNRMVPNFFASVSDELKKRIEGFTTIQKIEFMLSFSPHSRRPKLDRNDKRFQKFVLLNDLRNFLLHYKPRVDPMYFAEVDYKTGMDKLEKRARNEFPLNDPLSRPEGGALVYRCFNKHCALWAFNQVQPFLDWICDDLNIRRSSLDRHWDLSQP